MTDVALFLFGQPCSERAPHEPIALRGGKTIGLLGYLLGSNKRQSREHLAGLFWQDLAPAAARNNLRVLLSGINACIRSDGQSVFLTDSGRPPVGRTSVLAETHEAGLVADRRVEAFLLDGLFTARPRPPVGGGHDRALGIGVQQLTEVRSLRVDEVVARRTDEARRGRAARERGRWRSRRRAVPRASRRRTRCCGSSSSPVSSSLVVVSVGCRRRRRVARRGCDDWTPTVDAPQFSSTSGG